MYLDSTKLSRDEHMMTTSVPSSFFPYPVLFIVSKKRNHKLCNLIYPSF
ncbi:Hypothetical predicted protein [Podarcis lilfordi]|nr:Hypothetical predicted protein [Podarcis lilfordi]